MNRKTFLKLTPFALLAGFFFKANPVQAAARPRVWAAKLTQALTDDPSVTIITNDDNLTVTVTRDTVGVYSLTSPKPVFVDNKVFPTLAMGDAFVLTRLPKLFQFSNNPNLLKLFIVDANGDYTDGWITYLKLELYP